jgi:hypothetical protein
LKSRTTRVACRSCGQAYDLSVRLPARRLALQARKLAKEEGIDLPGAYSVALGIMTPEQIREFGSAGSTACRTAVPDNPEEDARAQHFDPAFQEAVSAGTLTARQARERGKRGVYISTLVERHGLSDDLAGAIADNRISLLEAMRSANTTRNVPVLSAGPQRRMTGAILLVVLVALVAIVVTRETGSVISTEQVAAIEAQGSAELLVDGSGRIQQVLGPSPRAVLEAYCAAANAEPVDVAPSPLPGPRSRVGLFHPEGNSSALRSITIREDREAGRWIAGEQGETLLPEPAPSGAERVLVRR